MIASWAEVESSGAALGDRRLNIRLAKVLSDLGERSTMSIPAACGGHAEMTAAYRFFDNERVTFAEVLAPHQAQTRKRLSAHPVVLFVQDTSEIDLTRPEQAVIGAGKLSENRRGVLLHEIQAYTPAGVPLGTAHAEVLNRTEDLSHEPAADKNKKRKQRPLEDKESHRWLLGLRQVRDMAAEHPGVCCVCVADSEADIYELYSEPRGVSNMHWVIRACQPRAVTDAEHAGLWEQALAAPVRYRTKLKVRGRTAKTKVEKRCRRQNRKSREIEAEVRSVTATLRPPHRPDRKLPQVTVHAVLVREINPPPGEPAVEWLLLTTLPIDSDEAVKMVVNYYRVRWNIETFFRTLKSGCRVEDRRFEHIDRMLPCLALYLIVAWRTLFVCHMGRECPDINCEAIFEPSEWKAAWRMVLRKRLPKKPPQLALIVDLVARLGGHVPGLGRQPGPQVTWIGLQRLHDFALAWDAFGPETNSEKDA